MSHPDYSAFAGAVPETADVTSLSAVALQMQEAEQEVEEAERDLKAKKARVQELSERTLPALMESAGISELKLKNGAKLTVKKELQIGSVTKKPEVLAWLERTGHGAKIKRGVSVSLGKDEERERKLLETLSEEGFKDVEVERWIEAPTLKAHVKVVLEEGGEVDMDLLGARQFDKAKITVSAKGADSAFEE